MSTPVTVTPSPDALPVEDLRSHADDQRRVWVLWLFVGLLTAGGVVFSRTRTFSPDEGFHLLAAKLINSGRKPYLDFFYQHPPLYPYLLGAWMRLVGQTWRNAHTLSALFTGLTTLLAASFVFRRLPAREWRLAGSLITATLVGLHLYMLWFGGVGQAYGFCLLMSVAAFRLATVSVERTSALAASGAGWCAGAASAASLLTAPLGPVLLWWIARHNRQGNLWRKVAAFLGAAAVPWCLWLWLAVQAPRQAVFDVFEFHLFYRQVNFAVNLWQQLTTLASWIDSPQTLPVVLLSAVGVVFLSRAADWPAAVRAEFRLCGWLLAAFGIYLSLAKPTFQQYFTLMIPFAGILATVGVYAIGSRLWGASRPAVPVALVMVLYVVGLARSGWIYRAFFNHLMQQVDAFAAEIDRVTPPHGRVYTTEVIYFASQHEPPPGLENMHGLRLQVEPALARSLRLVSNAQVDQWLGEGRFDTVVMMTGDERVEQLGLTRRYAGQKTLYGTYVLWDKRRP